MPALEFLVFCVIVFFFGHNSNDARKTNNTHARTHKQINKHTHAHIETLTDTHTHTHIVKVRSSNALHIFRHLSYFPARETLSQTYADYPDRGNHTHFSRLPRQFPQSPLKNPLKRQPQTPLNPLKNPSKNPRRQGLAFLVCGKGNYDYTQVHTPY